MSAAYPFLDVIEYGTHRRVSVVVWNVRAIYEADVEGTTVTRIEYLNGDTLDVTMDEFLVLGLFRHASGSVPTGATLNITPRVTIEQGRAFADEWIRDFLSSDGHPQAFGHSNVIEWPEEDERVNPNPAGIARYHAISEEIVRRVTAAMREPIAEAFVRVAGDVLARERRKQRTDI